jgi:hypothetical protein
MVREPLSEKVQKEMQDLYIEQLIRRTTAKGISSYLKDTSFYPDQIEPVVPVAM